MEEIRNIRSLRQNKIPLSIKEHDIGFQLLMSTLSNYDTRIKKQDERIKNLEVRNKQLADEIYMIRQWANSQARLVNNIIYRHNNLCDRISRARWVRT